jgi:hypothetical protein
MANVKDNNYLAALIRSCDGIASLNENIIVNKTVTIKKDDFVLDGAGHTIDGKGKNRLFHIKGKNVILKNLIFKNAKAPEGFFSETKGNGGAIYNEGQLHLINCEFIDNVAKNDGYDILNNGELKIECCNFSLQNGKNAVLNRSLIKAYDIEKSDLQPFISNNNVEWISSVGGITKHSTVDEVALELSTASKPVNDDNQGYILNQPFDAYEGDEPFIFVSYKHVDYEKVYPVIDAFHNAGINIWYDAGLPIGRNYDIQIAKHIMKSSLFVTFITEEAIKCSGNEDDYLIKELSVAIHLGKKCLPIYLDKVDLDGFYLMHYLHKQSILKFEYNDNEDMFIEACIVAFKNFGIGQNL